MMSSQPPRKQIDRLLFVYNADSGSFSALMDSARKLLSINGCALCSITHSLAGEKSEWKNCREEIGVPVDYVHRDEIDPDLAAVVHGSLPAVVAEAAGQRILLLAPDVLSRCRGSVADLKGRISAHAAMRNLELTKT